MPKTYDSIPTTHLNAGISFIHTGELPAVIHMDDYALDMMEDFEHMKPITISPNESIDNALIEMKVSGEHVLLVINELDEIIGLISSGDIQGVKPVKFTQEKRIHRSEIKVHMVMTPRDEVIVFEYSDLRFAKVGNVVATLQNKNQQYALVIKNVDTDIDKSKETVCGLFSLSMITKRLNAHLSAVHQPNSLAEFNKSFDKNKEN